MVSSAPARRAHRLPIRVYYEDTDFSGLVYHASYLRFLERGRTELLREAGIDHLTLFALDPPLALVVRSMDIAFDRAAAMDDQLVVETRLESIAGASMMLQQSVWRGEEPLVRARVRIACIARGKPVRLPVGTRSAMSAWLALE